MQKKKNSSRFPDGFNFYGRGKIVRESTHSLEKIPRQYTRTEEKNTCIITRLIDTDFVDLGSHASAGFCFFQFSKMPQNQSMALEMANILASQFATKISKELGSKVLVEPSRLATMEMNPNSFDASEVYSFQSEQENFYIRMMYLAPLSGNA